MIHFGKDIRNTSQNLKPDSYEGTVPEWHVDATADTGTSHAIPGRGYLYLCEWCEDAFFARTKAEAQVLFWVHEEAMHEQVNRPKVRCDALDHKQRQCIMTGEHMFHMTRWGDGLLREQFVWPVGNSPLVFARAPFLAAEQAARLALQGNHTTEGYAKAHERYETAMSRLLEFDKEHLA